MDRCIQALIESFDRYRTQQSTYEYPEDLLQDDGLSRNFLVSQLAALLLFANRVSTLTEQHNIEALKQPNRDLWDEIANKYRLFFAQPAPRKSGSA